MYIETDIKSIEIRRHRYSSADNIQEIGISYNPQKKKFESSDIKRTQEFIDMLNTEIKGKKVSLETFSFNGTGGTYELMYVNKKPFMTAHNNKMVSLHLYKMTELPIGIDFDCFVFKTTMFEEAICDHLRYFSASKLKELPMWFQPKHLRTAYLPECKIFMPEALDCSPYLRELYVPNLKIINDHSLRCNYALRKFIAPKLEYMGNAVLCHNKILDTIDIRNVEHIGDYALHHNEKLDQLYAPKCTEVGTNALFYNNKLQIIALDSGAKIGENAFANIPEIADLYMNKKMDTISNRLNKQHVH